MAVLDTPSLAINRWLDGLSYQIPVSSLLSKLTMKCVKNINKQQYKKYETGKVRNNSFRGKYFKQVMLKYVPQFQHILTKIIVRMLLIAKDQRTLEIAIKAVAE